jgi:hypothetical protein
VQQVHRLAALWQFMELKGVGLKSKLGPEQRKLVEGKTASHLMFGFAGAAVAASLGSVCQQRTAASTASSASTGRGSGAAMCQRPSLRPLW